MKSTPKLNKTLKEVKGSAYVEALNLENEIIEKIRTWLRTTVHGEYLIKKDENVILLKPSILDRVELNK